jgi:hypothetical protein
MTVGCFHDHSHLLIFYPYIRPFPSQYMCTNFGPKCIFKTINLLHTPQVRDTHHILINITSRRNLRFEQSSFSRYRWNLSLGGRKILYEAKSGESWMRGMTVHVIFLASKNSFSKSEICHTRFGVTTFVMFLQLCKKKKYYFRSFICSCFALCYRNLRDRAFIA